jgi:hypothetical protein
MVGCDRKVKDGWPMPEPLERQLHLNAPPEYEMKLLTALSFFLGRKVTSQALACLSMYLRQSEPRIMSQVRYYAHKASKASGQEINEYEMLDLIFEDPERAASLLQGLGVVHHPNEIKDAFEAEGT